MKIRPLSIDGAFEVRPDLRGDSRGMFMEWYRWEALADAVGHPLNLAQANISVSAAGVARGIHFAEVPVGQAKYVACVRGSVVDVIVDLRVGSPTFGKWEMVRLDDVDRRSVYVAEGLGHGFCALTDDATLVYMCSSVYNPAKEHSIHPLDPELGIAWPFESPQLSVRDAAAPTIQQAGQQGLLPGYEACQEYTQRLRAGDV